MKWFLCVLLLVLTGSFLNAQEEAVTTEKEWEAMIKECVELMASKSHYEAIEVGKKAAKLVADKYGKENWRVGKSILLMSMIYEQLGSADPATKEIAASGFKRAAAIFKKAAESGDAEGQYNLGLVYASGHGVPKDLEQAVKWWHKAAEQGHAKAQFNLGTHYHIGEGVDKDDKEAVKWLRKAADQGFAFAQYNLGVMYGKGEGVAKDNKEAVKWLRKAAEQENADAIELLKKLGIE